MTLLHRLASVLRWIVNRNKAEGDLDDELRAFVEMATADHMRDGATPTEARRLALVELGGSEQVKERVRTGRHGGRLDEIGRDVRYGLRQVRRNPAFSAVAIATLALGIGVNTAMFSAVDAILIRPLPYADADRLVMILDAGAREGAPAGYASTPAEWHEWRRHNTVFTDIAASQPTQVALSGYGEPEDLPARKVSGNFWSVLGATPLLGRTFTEAEDAQGARVVVISHGLWQRRFGTSPDVVGRSITLNDQAYQVVGVMPRGFYFFPSRDIDVWMATSFSPAMLGHWSLHEVDCVGRLAPDASLAQARASMVALSLRLTAEHLPQPRSATVTPIREQLTGKTYTSLMVLLGATAAVLLIACVNLANLLLSRGIGRRREVAVRAALGAGQGRLVRQFLIESLVLAGLGAVAALALALPIMRFLEVLVPQTMAAVELTLDWRVLTASAVIALAAGITFGLLPALDGSRLALQDALRDGARGSAGARSYWLQHSLIVIETGLAVVLLVVSGLLLQTFQHFRQIDLGFRGDRLLTLVTPLFRYPEFDGRVAFVNAQLERIAAVPGVSSAGAISRVPLTAPDQATFYRFEGQSDIDTRDQVALSRIVTREYFKTVGANLREGRFFEISDRRSDAPAAIVNESFANRHFPGVSPLGVRFQFGNHGPKGYWYAIVGIVRDIRDRGVAQEMRPTVYLVHEQADQIGMPPSGIVIRTAVGPASIVPAVREAIWSVDKNQPIAGVQTIDDIVTRQLSLPSQSTALSGTFALLALVLASVGLYGVLSSAVTQRTHEIGVRMALGAQARDILLSVGMRGLTLTLSGLAIGAVLSVLTAQALRTLFYGFPPSYLSPAAVAGIVLLGVATVACFIPAWRASRVRPVIALRQE
jgi:putative ABC transport system permease protein